MTKYDLDELLKDATPQRETEWGSPYGGWQDISTAPKTGAGRGMYSGEERGPEIMLSDGSSIYIGFWNGHSWDDGDYHDHMTGLTHWMPLPEPPETKP